MRPEGEVAVRLEGQPVRILIVGEFALLVSVEEEGYGGCVQVGLRLEVDDPGAGARSVIVGAVMSTLKEYEAACPMLLAESVAFTLKV